ncbi:MAG: hypothetical protein KGJ36_02210 [Acidobacteriota bacterium]|nr:hypothetical protein [Acidobacteriota bacterium]
MTTVTAGPIGRAGTATVPGHHVRLWQAVRAEWVKLRSTRSTWISLGLIMAVGVGLDVLITIVTANAWNGGGLQDRLQYDPVRTAQAGMLVAQFVVGVLGVMTVTGEYTSGLMRTTIASVSHRWTILASKAIVLATTLLVVGEATAFTSGLVSRLILLGRGARVVAHNTPALQATSRFIPVLPLTDPGALRATVLSGVYITLLGLCGLALGFALRSTAGAISLFVGALLVVPIIANMLPASISAHFNAWLPNTLGSAMMIVTLHHNAYGGDFLNPWAATAVLAGYALVLLTLGAGRLLARDA